MKPEPLVRDEVKHRNKWVAVRRGDVLLEADTEVDLLTKICRAHLARDTYVIRYIDEPPRGYVVGVG